MTALPPEPPVLTAERRAALWARPVSLRSREDRRLVARLLPRIVAVRLWLDLSGFDATRARIARRLDPAAGAPADPAVLAAALRAGRIAAGLGRRLPFDGTCLVQSLALWWLLRRDGLPAELRIGVERRGEALAAHAWVELCGEPVSDSPEAIARFAPFERITP